MRPDAVVNLLRDRASQTLRHPQDRLLLADVQYGLARLIEVDPGIFRGRLEQLTALREQVEAVSATHDPIKVAELMGALQTFLGEELQQATQGLQNDEEAKIEGLRAQAAAQKQAEVAARSPGAGVPGAPDPAGMRVPTPGSDKPPAAPIRDEGPRSPEGAAAGAPPPGAPGQPGAPQAAPGAPQAAIPGTVADPGVTGADTQSPASAQDQDALRAGAARVEPQGGTPMQPNPGAAAPAPAGSAPAAAAAPPFAKKAGEPDGDEGKGGPGDGDGDEAPTTTKPPGAPPMQPAQEGTMGNEAGAASQAHMVTCQSCGHQQAMTATNATMQESQRGAPALPEGERQELARLREAEATRGKKDRAVEAIKAAGSEGIVDPDHLVSFMESQWPALLHQWSQPAFVNGFARGAAAAPPMRPGMPAGAGNESPAVSYFRESEAGRSKFSQLLAPTPAQPTGTAS